MVEWIIEWRSSGATWWWSIHRNRYESDKFSKPISESITKTETTPDPHVIGSKRFLALAKPTHFVNKRAQPWPISSHMTLPISSNDFRFLMMKVEFLCTWWFFYFQNISDFLSEIFWNFFFINHSKIWNITLILIILFYRRDPRGGNFQCLTV